MTIDDRLYLVLGIIIGLFIAILWRCVRARGHSLYGVASDGVQRALTGIIARYTSLVPLHCVNAGPTHQQIFSGGTVFAWFDNLLEKDLPPNARSFVVWGKKRRLRAAEELVIKLRSLGYTATIREPLTDFPPGTFLMVVSSAFLENAVAFQPHGLRMFYLAPKPKPSEGPKHPAW